MPQINQQSILRCPLKAKIEDLAFHSSLHLEVDMKLMKDTNSVTRSKRCYGGLDSHLQPSVLCTFSCSQPGSCQFLHISDFCTKPFCRASPQDILTLSCDALLRECRSALASQKSRHGTQNRQPAPSAEHYNHVMTPEDTDATQPFLLPPSIEALRMSKKSRFSPVSASFPRPCCACLAKFLTRRCRRR